jgi:hypothetical protein
MNRASSRACVVAILHAVVVAASCSPERKPPAPVSFDEQPTRAEPALEPAARVEVAQPAARAAERIGLVPTGLAEFDIQALPQPLDELREAARREIGPENADKELERLKSELGARQP